MQNVARTKWAYGAVLFCLAVVAAFSLFAGHALAHPSSVFSQASTASSTNINVAATTSVTFMTGGTATTTYQFDSNTFSQGAAGKVPNVTGIDASSLFVLFNASTSGSMLAWQIQYSNNNIDWYNESSAFATAGNNIASSTSLTNITVLQESTSTIHAWAPGVSGVSMKVVNLPATPAIHERIVFSIPNGSANGAFYTEVDLKQNPSNP